VQLSPKLESSLERIVSKTIILVLLIGCFVGVGLLGVVAKKNTSLNIAYQAEYKKLDIYTIPSSKLRLDIISPERVRLNLLVNRVINQMLIFTPSNNQKQLNSVKTLLSPSMLVEFNAQFTKGGESDSSKFKIYQVFVHSGDSLHIRTTGKKSANGSLVREVTLAGKLKKFNRNKRDETFTVQNMQINIEVEETSISKTNPYGFMVSKFQTKILE
jgi:hypothetical protein